MYPAHKTFILKQKKIPFGVFFFVLGFALNN